MGLLGSVEGDGRTLRAWQLALLRYAVTLDDTDRMNVMAIAKEIDCGRRGPAKRANFCFFRRTSADLCAAILRQDEAAETLLQQYLAQIDDDRLKRAFAGAIEMDDQAFPVRRPRMPKPTTCCGKDLHPAAPPGLARADQPTCVSSDECFARHAGPGPRM
jgi:hypothetical protein